MTTKKNLGFEIYIPPRNWQWLEWRQTLVGLALVVALVVAWCAIGERFL